jgi:hypothetical protein
MRTFHSLSTIIPVRSELTQNMIDSSRDLSLSEILSGQEIRPGTEVPPYQRILQFMPNFSARLY